MLANRSMLNVRHALLLQKIFLLRTGVEPIEPKAFFNCTIIMLINNR